MIAGTPQISSALNLSMQPNYYLLVSFLNIESKCIFEGFITIIYVMAVCPQDKHIYLIFSPLALDGGKRLASRPSRFNLAGKQHSLPIGGEVTESLWPLRPRERFLNPATNRTTIPWSSRQWTTHYTQFSN